MDEEKYRPNSHLYREQHKKELPPPPVEKVEAVVTGEVKMRKKRAFQQFVSNLFAEDMDAVKDYILWDFIVPKGKALFANALTTTINMALGVENRPQDPNGPRRIQYDRIYGSSRGPAIPVRQRGFRQYEPLVFETRGDAEIVLEEMRRMAWENNRVSLNEMYDLAGYDCSTIPYDAAKIGWYGQDFVHARVVFCEDGYYIRLPRPRTI